MEGEIDYAMYCLSWLRSKAQIISGIIFWIFLFSFGLQSNVDIFTKISYPQSAISISSRFKKADQYNHQRHDQLVLSADDQSAVCNQMELKAPQFFTFHSCFKIFIDIESASIKSCTEARSSVTDQTIALFLQNRALLI